MKTFVLQTLILTLFISVLSAQKNSSLDFMIGIDYTNRTKNELESPMVFTDDNGDIVSESVRVGLINPRIGLSYNHRLAKKLWIKTGMRFSKVGYAFDTKDAPLGSSFIDFKVTENTTFIGIPLLLRYEFSEGDWSSFVEGGVEVNYYIQSIAKTETSLESSNNKQKNKFETVNQWQYSTSISFGFKYKIMDNFYFITQPNFRYFLSPHLNEEFDLVRLNFHHYSFGLEMGCRMMI